MNQLRNAFLAVAMILGIIAMVGTAAATNDYFTYGVKNPAHSVYAIEGYPINDESGLLYVADVNGYCYIYKVSIPAGADPNTHPFNPLNTGTMAIRTFELIQTYNFKADSGWDGDHHAEFYISDDSIYYGVYTGGIEKWDKNADGTFSTYRGKVTDINGVAIPGNGDETFGYDSDNNIWYTVDRSRNVYSFDADVDTSWQFEFTHTDYGGNHHDGMEFVNGYLWVSDMTTDKIGQWEKTGTSWNEVEVFEYSNTQYVEGMGFSPLGHFWISSGSVFYEIGGGKLSIALTDIPGQIILSGESFVTFDLDDYAGGATGLTWTAAGHSDLTVFIDGGTNVCTITYPTGWTGSNTVTFTAVDADQNSYSDDATFTVKPITNGEIPEFPTIAIPMIAILGLAFMFQRRKD